MTSTSAQINIFNNTPYDKVYIISDPEGYAITDVIDKSDNNMNIIVCGDIIDSTFVGPLPDKYLEKKSKNLKNIYDVITNQNIRLIFGNRDLNKIKCKYLLTLNENEKNELIHQFNTGNISLEEITYNELKTAISKNKPWKIHGMKQWSTFWSPSFGSGKNWAEEPFYNESPFLIRFYEMFGIDNGKDKGGTMSAQNLISTIPKELNIESTNLDYKAFVTLAIFKALLCDKINPTNINSSDFTKVRTTNVFQGWLITLYKKGLSCGYYQNGNKMMIFSHGGVTNKLIENEKAYDQMDEMLANNSAKFTDIFDKPSNINSVAVPAGGYYNENQNNIFELQYVKNRLNNINGIITKKINNILTENQNITGKPSLSMLFLLMLTSGFNSDTYFKNNIVGPAANCGLDKSRPCESIISLDLGPIMPGLFSLRTKNFYIKENEIDLIQFVGHIPVGYAPVIDYFNNNGKKCFHVNLDNSNTFVGTEINIDKSYNYVIVQKDNKILFHTDIPLSSDKLKKMKYTVDMKYPLNEKLQSEILGATSVLVHSFGDMIIPNRLTYNIELNNILEQIKKTKDKKELNYHGSFKLPVTLSIGAKGAFAKPEMKQLNIFTYNAPTGFNKALFILSNDDFNTFLNISNLKLQLNQTGGDIYFKKYMKYKIKYNQLKQIKNV